VTTAQHDTADILEPEIIRSAVQEIKRFARNENVPRPHAEKLLNLWGNYGYVRAETRKLILAHFPEPAEPDPVPYKDFLPVEAATSC
jgi:hypothetical protein